MIDLKITIDQLKNYLGTGLKFQLLYDCHDEFYEMEDCKGYQHAFTKGSIWEFMGWSDLEIPMGEGDFYGELLQHESGIYMGNYGTHKPICYRLSDLDKFIPELGFVPIEELRQYAPLGRNFGFSIEKDSLGFIGYRTPESWLDPLLHIQFFEKLFQWNFWPFEQEYFTEGLVIDKLKHRKEASNE